MQLAHTSERTYTPHPCRQFPKPELIWRVVRREEPFTGEADLRLLKTEAPAVCLEGEGGGGGTEDSGHGVSGQARADVQLIGWQNTWEQAPGVPANPFPALMAGGDPGRVPVYTVLKRPTTTITAPVVEQRQA